MDSVSIILVVIAALALALILYAIVFYNKIVEFTNMAKRAWANVISWQRKELRALELMSEKMKEFMDFERETLTDITKLREASAKLDENKIDFKALKTASEISHKMSAYLDARREAYPELKTGELYKSYMREVSESEAQVVASLTVFNRGVESFNSLIQIFPNNVFNGIFFHRQPLQEFSDSKAESQFDYRPNF